MQPRKTYLLFIILLYATSCEDVISVDVPTGKSRLIVDALIRVDTTEQFIPVVIKVTETTNFFEHIPVTSLENVIIIYETTDASGVTSTGTSSLIDVEVGSGLYIPDPNFSVDQRIKTSVLENENVLFSLIMDHKGRKYIAQTRYVKSAALTKVEQGTQTLFNKEETEIVVAFKDNKDTENFYVFDFDFNEFLVTEDTFYNGQEFEFSYFYDKDLEPGRELSISILGSDLTFYNYMNQLLEQTEGSQGPFQTPSSTVRGNIFDITDLDNQSVFDNVQQSDVFPLGYFAIVQEYKRTITLN